VVVRVPKQGQGAYGDGIRIGAMEYACSGSPGVAATAVNVVTRRSVCICCGRLRERFEESLEAVEAVSFPNAGLLIAPVSRPLPQYWE